MRAFFPKGIPGGSGRPGTMAKAGFAAQVKREGLETGLTGLTGLFGTTDPAKPLQLLFRFGRSPLLQIL